MEEEYELDQEELKVLHAGLLKNDNVDEVYIGSQDEFLSFIGNDPKKLAKVRANLIEDGKMTANQLGGGEDAFMYSFTKKKEKEEPTSEGSNTPSSLGEEPTEPTPANSPSIGELKLADWDQITDYSAYGDRSADRYNKILQEEYDNELVHTKMIESADKFNNGEKNKIAEHKNANPINFEERAYRIGGIDIKKSHTKEGLEKLEKELNEEFNPDGFKSWSKDIRQSLAYSYEEDIVSNLNAYLEKEGADIYKAGVTNPKYLNDWKKYASKHVFGEMLDPAFGYIQGAVDQAIIHNEYTYHTSKRVDDYKEKYNISEKDALIRVEMEDVAQQRKHLEANMNKKELARYEIQKRIDKLEEEDVNGSNFNKIYEENLKLKGEEQLYGTDGQRLVMPENEDMALEAQEVNAQIVNYNKQKNFKDQLRETHHDNWNIYQNLLRASEKAKKDYNFIDKLNRATSTLKERADLNEAKANKDHIDTLLRKAKIKVDATGQMLFANENLAKSENKLVMTREVIETMVNTMPALFPAGMNNKSTPFQKTEAFVETLAEMGHPMTPEQLDEIDWEGAEWARAGGNLGSIALKMIAFNKIAGITGATEAVKALGSGARLKSAAFIAKGGKAGRFAAPSLGKLSEHAILGTWEGAAFQVIDGSFSTGALFYGANQAFSGAEQILGGKGGVLGGILKRNKKFALLLKAMVRGSASMTTGMEVVATTEAVIEGWINDKQISTEMEEMWGAESDWEKRVIMNLALSTMMGMPMYGKMAKKGLMPNLNERTLELQERLFSEGKIELGIEVANVRGGIIDSNIYEQTQANLTKKFKYLTKKKGVLEKDLKRSNGEYKLEEINEQFDLAVGDNISLYDTVLGKGSADISLAKKRVLKKLGLPVENRTLGQIEADHYTYLHDNVISKKWGRKVGKESKKEDARIRKEKIKELEEQSKELDQNEALLEAKQELENARKESEAKKEGFRDEIEELYDEVRDWEYIKLLQERLVKMSSTPLKKSMARIDLEATKLEISMAKKRLKKAQSKFDKVDAELIEGLKENSVDNSLTENSDTVEKIENSKRAKRTELESQVLISNKKIDRDQTKSKLDKVSREYGKKAKNKEWESVKEHVKQALESVSEVIKVMKMIEMNPKQIERMMKIQADLTKNIESETVVTAAQFKKTTDKIIDQTKAFSSKALSVSINDQIQSSYKKKSPHKNSLIAEAFDMIFNKSGLERELNNPKITEVRAKAINKKLDAYKKTQAKLDRVIDNKLTKRDALEKIEESGSKEFEKISEEVDKSIKNIEVYEGISNALMNAESRGSVRDRKSELRREGMERELSESELVEYEVLNLFDGSTMTQNQLANAHRSVSRIISEGRSIHASEKVAKKIRDQVMKAEFVRDIFNKSFDATTLKVNPEIATEVNAVMRAYKGARMYIESFTTMMDHMMSHKIGRDIGTGSGHALVDGLIQANSREQSSTARFMNETLTLMTHVFGSTTNAQTMFKKAGMGKRNPTKHYFDIVGAENKPMTIPEAMTLYSYMRQPDQIARLEGEGYQILKNGKLEGASIKSLENRITELAGREMIDWVDTVTETLLPKVWNVVNETYKKDKGVDLDFVERYFPVFRYRKGGNDSLVKGDPDNPLPSDHLAATNKTHLQDRTGGEKYRLRDFNDVMFEYISTSMHYVNYESVIRDMNTLFKDESVHDIIHKRFTNQANKSIKSLIEDLAAGQTQSGVKIEWLDKARRAFARAKLGFNPTLLPKQMVSISAFMSEMNAAESARYITRVPKWSTVEMLMNTPELQNRYRINEFNRDLAERTKQTDMMSEKQIEDRIVLSKGKGLEWFKLKNLRDNQLIATKWGDLGANLYGGAKMYDTRYETLRNDGYSHTEASNMAKLAVIKGIERTQQSGAIHNLSMLQRAGSYGKLISLFQNTPLQYLRIEMAALDNMKESLANARSGGIDGGKLANSAKTFMVYHFILPQLFRAATQGFYLGDDRSFMDDPDILLGLLGGSFQYAPIVGAGMMSILNKMNKGYSFGISQNILTDMLEDTDGVLEQVADWLMNSEDPAPLTIEFEDIWESVNSGAQWFGVPTQSLGTWATGITDYLQGKTNNPLALGGYSKSVYQGTLLSNDIDDINMYLPKNGGSLDLFIDHMRNELGDGKFEKQKSRLIREYRMYSRYDTTNSHVNYLYQGTEGSHEQANYLVNMFKAEVEEVKRLRPNYTLRQLRNDIEKGAVYTYPEFMSWTEELLENGVITKKAYEDFILQLEMRPAEFKEIFDFL